MCAMSEESLPPFKYLNPRRYPSRLREAAGRLMDRLRRGEPAEARPDAPPGRSKTEPGAEVGEKARERAAAALREHLAQNSTNVERAARMREAAGRLEREGTPSDSARNRAERAREEVAEGIARLRRSLSAAGDDESAQALDLETAKLDPPIRPAEIRP